MGAPSVLVMLLGPTSVTQLCLALVSNSGGTVPIPKLPRPSLLPTSASEALYLFLILLFLPSCLCSPLILHPHSCSIPLPPKAFFIPPPEALYWLQPPFVPCLYSKWGVGGLGKMESLQPSENEVHPL